MGRNKKLILNTITPIVIQILSVASGLILPRLRLVAYGSEVNGLVNSISQFLGVISFLELGVGAVVKSALYKPLAENDTNELNRIMSSAHRFFSKLGKILLCYVLVLCFVYPLVVHSSFSKMYIILLIVASSISLVSQYFLGIVCRLLINADQKIYIQYILQGIQIILNFGAWVILIKTGAPIHVAVFASALVFLIGPVYMSIYVKHIYHINFHVKCDSEPIKQKWNGIAQHIAAIVLDSTDIVILSLFATLSDVAVYSIYQMVVVNINSLFLSAMNGIQSLLGELWAKKELETLRIMFDKVEWATHLLVTFIFGCSMNLIVPFVLVYTKDVTDANYNQVLFGIMLVFAFMFYALKNPYNVLILAAGKYRETQHIFIAAALINVLISIITVNFWGLIGVAVGTAIAMIYEMLAMAVYISKSLINRPMSLFLKQILADGITITLGFFWTNDIILCDYSYLAWVMLAIKHVLCWFIVCILVNIVLYGKKVLNYLNM